MPNREELLELLLNNRGIEKENWDSFLNPSYEKGLYDPFLLKDMEVAVVRIFEAIEAKEKIVIYSDYDADGIPASVIMHDFFKKINYNNFSVYIPHRHDEGYGLHMDAIREFVESNVNLIITLDLGITAIEEVIEAKTNNIDVIIIDHHLPRRSITENEVSSLENNIKEKEEDLLPPAFAIIDPKRKDCIYKDKMLCGAGLSFKFIQAFISKYGEYFKINEGWEKWLLDMAGVATLSDQVPLINENRVIAYYGLLVLKKSKRQGLKELWKKAGVDIKNLNEEDITFTLAPRINVASRMANPMIAFDLLAEGDSVKAKNIADMLEKINNERKITVAHIMKEVKQTLSKRFENEDFGGKPFVVIGNPKWNIGVLGIVASKIVDEYKKSVFVWGGEEGDIKGSCRGYGEVNLVEIMSNLPSGSLLEFGGHKMAGGFSVSREEIHFLEERILSVYEEYLYKKEKDKTFLLEYISDSSIESFAENKIDASINIDDVNEENYKIIKRLAPYGAGNPKPTFLIKNIEIFSIKEFGKEKNHLELSFKNSRSKIIKAIAFFKTRHDFSAKTVLAERDIIDIIVNIEKNNFLGKNELRLRIIDII